MDMGGAVDLTAPIDKPAEELGITKELYDQAKHERRLVGKPVRPEGLVVAVNREMRRAAARRVKKLGLDKPPEPIDLRKRNPAKNKAEAVERVVDLLLTSQPHLFDGTVETLSRFLTTYEAAILREANAKGLPLPKEYIRSALMSIHAEGEKRRAHAAAKAAAYGPR